MRYDPQWFLVNDRLDQLRCEAAHTRDALRGRRRLGWRKPR